MILKEEIITNQEDIRKGFLWQAKKKRELTESFIKSSREAKTKLKKVNSFEEMVDDNNLFDFIVGSLMLSKKSLLNLSKPSVIEIIKEEIDFYKLKEQNYLNKLERNYLFTSGEYIGGQIRNLIGHKGEEIFTDMLKNILYKNNIEYRIEENNKDKIKSILWDDKKIIFNHKPLFIGKSIDFLVLKSNDEGVFDLEDPYAYSCAGELKSGIDPAGADEHWKTARTALKRISKTFIDFNISRIPLFFIGGAISNYMADEIVELIENKKIDYAANLNHSIQLESICNKIIFS